MTNEQRAKRNAARQALLNALRELHAADTVPTLFRSWWGTATVAKRAGLTAARARALLPSVSGVRLHRLGTAHGWALAPECRKAPA